MATIVIKIDGAKYKVNCKDLIPVVSSHFELEVDKNKWDYVEFCDIVQKLPHEAIIKFINDNTNTEVKSQNPISFEIEKPDTIW